MSGRPDPNAQSPEQEGEDGKRMSLFDHLTELRSRLMRVAISVLVLGFLALIFARPIFGFLMQPVLDALPADARSLIYTSGVEELNVLMKVGLYVGIFLTTPVLLWQLWGFVSPGLYAAEKRMAAPFVLSGSVAFLLGLAFCYLLILPPMFTFLLNEEDSLELEQQLGTARAQSDNALRYAKLGSWERAERLARDSRASLINRAVDVLEDTGPQTVAPSRTVEVNARVEGFARLLDASIDSLPTQARPQLLRVVDKQVEANAAQARGAHDAAAIALDDAAGLLGGAVGKGKAVAGLWALEKELAAGKAAYDAKRWTRPMLTMKEQLSLVLIMLLAFGIIFQLPIVLALLGMVGLVDSRFLFKYQRHAFVVCLILAAVLTPTGDVINLSLMAGPMMLCYELGVLAVWLMERRRPREAPELGVE